MQPADMAAMTAPPPPPKPKEPATLKWFLSFHFGPGAVAEGDELSFTAWNKPVKLSVQSSMIDTGRIEFPVPVPRAADKRDAFISKLHMRGLTLNGCSAPTLGDRGLRVSFGPKDKAPEGPSPPNGTESTDFVAELQSRVAELEAQTKAQAEQVKAKAEAHELERARWKDETKAKAEAHKLERARWEEQLNSLSVEKEGAQEKLSKEAKSQKGLADKYKQMRSLHKAVSEANTKLNEQLAAANKRLQVLERQSRAVLAARGDDDSADLGGGAKKQRLS